MEGGPYFPTQNRAKIRSTTSSRTLRPVSSPSAAMAPSTSVRTASGVMPRARPSDAAHDSGCFHI